MDNHLKIKLLIEKQLNIEVSLINDISTIHQLGGDELDLVELIMKIEEKFNLKINDDNLSNVNSVTVKDLIVASENSPMNIKNTNHIESSNDLDLLQIYEVGEFKTLQQKSNPNNYIVTYVPKLEDVVNILEKQLKRKLTNSECENLKQDAIAIALP